VVNDLAVPVEPTLLASRLRPVLLKLNRELRRELRSLGVTGGQVSLLFAISQSPGVGVRELAARERMSPAAMSGYVTRLERAGLASRTQDPVDRRRQGLRVTPEGDRILRLSKSRRTAWLAARLKRLEPDELAAIEAALEPLTRLLEEDA
jgi:DNA-binding MarR family transcriptional regulator